MNFSATLERAALDQYEPRWRERGYTIIREPARDQLPGFLGGFQPDAIAIGPSPSLVIEVVRKRSGTSDAKIRRLKGLFDDQKDWRLEVLYVAQDRPELGPVESRDIRDAMRQSRSLAEQDTRAGLLMAWATLEAIIRRLEPQFAALALQSGSMVDLLVSNGHVSQSDGEKLRRLGEMRNRLSHGQLDILPTADDVTFLTDPADSLSP